MAIFTLLKIDGIDGESAVKSHENSIDIIGWQWGVAQCH